MTDTTQTARPARHRPQVRGHRDQGCIGRLGQVIHGGVAGQPLHAVAFGVHRQDAPRIACLEHRGDGSPADAGHVVGRPDHGHRTGGDQPVDMGKPAHSVASDPRIAVHWLDSVPTLP